MHYGQYRPKSILRLHRHRLSSYHAYVGSRLSYGIIFWGNAVDVDRIFLLQKSCLRSIFNLRKRDSCRHTFKDNGILTLPAVYVFECACFGKKHYWELLSQYEGTHTYDTRECVRTTLRVPQTTYTTVHKSAVTQILRIYNTLPSKLKMCELKSFKKQLKERLVQQCLYSVSEFFNMNFS